MIPERRLITVLDVTYIATREGGPPQFIGLWYTDGQRAELLNFALNRADILALEAGDKGHLTQKNGQWDFILRGNA